MVREYGVGQVSCWVGEVREEGRHNADCEGSKGRERCTDYGSPDFDDAPVERSYCLVGNIVAGQTLQLGESDDACNTGKSSHAEEYADHDPLCLRHSQCPDGWQRKEAQQQVCGNVETSSNIEVHHNVDTFPVH